MAGRIASWNPLRCSGTALPVHLLVMAKSIAIALLLTNHVKLLPTPFLPFVPGLDSIPALAFQRTIQGVFLVSAATLLLNRWVRLSSFLLGLSMLLGVLASKAYYGNNKTFCGLILLLTGLYEGSKSIWILRLQLVIVYLGAGLNKLMDPDWQSGLFFNYWATVKVHDPIYMALDRQLPSMLLAKGLSWFTIFTEIGLSVAFLVRRLFPWAIWLSLIFHAGMTYFTGSTFTMFFYAMTASMLVFAPWPVEPLLILYDGDCGFCTSTKRWAERLDLDRVYEWRPFQSGAGRAYGIADEAATERLYLVDRGKIYSGFRAFKIMVLYNPVSYLVTYTVLAATGTGPSTFRTVAVVFLLVVFSPLFNPIGEAVYGVVARNRSTTCRVPASRAT